MRERPSLIALLAGVSLGFALEALSKEEALLLLRRGAFL